MRPPTVKTYPENKKLQLCKAILHLMNYERKHPERPYFSYEEMIVILSWLHLTSDLSEEIWAITARRKSDQKWRRYL